MRPLPKDITYISMYCMKSPAVLAGIVCMYNVSGSQDRVKPKESGSSCHIQSPSTVYSRMCQSEIVGPYHSKSGMLGLKSIRQTGLINVETAKDVAFAAAFWVGHWSWFSA